eukprot:14426128-Alexandrium_andersonii.AAC.1
MSASLVGSEMCIRDSVMQHCSWHATAHLKMVTLLRCASGCLVEESTEHMPKRTGCPKPPPRHPAAPCTRSQGPRTP